MVGNGDDYSVDNSLRMKIFQAKQDLMSEMLGYFIFELPIIAEATTNSPSGNVLEKSNNCEYFKLI